MASNDLEIRIKALVEGLTQVQDLKDEVTDLTDQLVEVVAPSNAAGNSLVNLGNSSAKTGESLTEIQENAEALIDSLGTLSQSGDLSELQRNADSAVDSLAEVSIGAKGLSGALKEVQNEGKLPSDLHSSATELAGKFHDAAVQLAGLGDKAVLSGSDLRAMASAGEQALDLLGVALLHAQAELERLSNTDGSPKDIEEAREKVERLKGSIEEVNNSFTYYQTVAVNAMTGVSNAAQQTINNVQKFTTVDLSAVIGQAQTVTRHLESMGAGATYSSSEFNKLKSAGNQALDALEAELQQAKKELADLLALGDKASFNELKNAEGKVKSIASAIDLTRQTYSQFDTTATRAMGNVSEATKGAGEAASGATGKTDKFGKALDEVEGHASKASKAVEGVGKAGELLTGAFAALGITLGAKEILDTADAYKSLEGRIGLVVGKGTALTDAMKGVKDVALETNSNLAATGGLFSKIAELGKKMNLDNQQALALTKTINQAIQVGGGSAEASEAAITQLNQALSSGVLRGDEFNSIMEQAPRLATALADSLGVTTGELRKMAEAGELTSDKVIRGLQGQAGVIQKEFSQMPLTVGAAIENLKTSFMVYIGEVDKANGISTKAAEAIKFLAENLDTVASVIEKVGEAYLAYKAFDLAADLMAKANASKDAAQSIAAESGALATNTAQNLQNATATKTNAAAKTSLAEAIGGEKDASDKAKDSLDAAAQSVKGLKTESDATKDSTDKLGTSLGEVAGEAEKGKEKAEEHTGKLENLKDASEKAGEAQEALKQGLGGVKTELSDSKTKAEEHAGKLENLKEASEKAAEGQSALKEGLTGAKEEGEKGKEEAEEHAGKLENLKEASEKAAEGQEALKEGLASAKEGTEGAAESTEGLGGKVSGLTEKFSGALARIGAFAGAAIGFIAAGKAIYDTLDEVGTSIGENIAAWNLHRQGLKSAEEQMEEMEKAEKAELERKAQLQAATNAQNDAVKKLEIAQQGLSGQSKELVKDFDALIAKGKDAKEALAGIADSLKFDSLKGIDASITALVALEAQGKLTEKQVSAIFADTLKGQDLIVFETNAKAAFGAVKGEIIELEAANARHALQIKAVNTELAGVNKELKKQQEEYDKLKDKSTPAAEAMRLKIDQLLQRTSELTGQQRDYSKAVKDSEEKIKELKSVHNTEAEKMAKVQEEILNEAMRRTGLTVEELKGKASIAFTQASNDIQVTINNMAKLKEEGVDTGLMLSKQFENAINTAGSQAQLDALKAKIKQNKDALGETVTNGLLQQAEDAAIRVKQRMDDMLPGIQSATEALKTFGLQSKAELEGVADKAATSYAAIANSSEVTASVQKKALQQYIDAAYASEDATRIAAANNAAAVQGMVVKVDAGGRATLQSLFSVAQGTDAVSAGYGNIGNAAQAAANKTTQAAQQAISSLDAWIAKMDAATKASGGTTGKSFMDKPSGSKMTDDLANGLNQTGMMAYSNADSIKKLLTDGGMDEKRAALKARELMQDTSWANYKAVNDDGTVNTGGLMGGELTNYNYVNKQVAELLKYENGSGSKATMSSNLPKSAQSIASDAAGAAVRNSVNNSVSNTSNSTKVTPSATNTSTTPTKTLNFTINVNGKSIPATTTASESELVSAMETLAGRGISI